MKKNILLIEGVVLMGLFLTVASLTYLAVENVAKMSKF